MEILESFTSSSIAWAAYDRENKVLHIVYQGNQAKYAYGKVPEKKWRALQEAGSKGQYVNFHIKPFHKVNQEG